MTKARRGLLFCLLALSALVAPLGPGTAQDPYFTLRLCNTGDARIGVAVAFREQEEPWLIAGWVLVDQQSCAIAGRALKGWFYLYAEEATDKPDGEKRVWQGSDANLCVEYPGPFRREVVPGGSCEANELKSFVGMVAPEHAGTYTMNFNWTGD